MTSRPTRGVCDVPLMIHIDKGRYGDISLDDLNVVLVMHTPGPMGEGDWTVAAYVDERANEGQARRSEQSSLALPVDPCLPSPP